MCIIVRYKTELYDIYLSGNPSFSELLSSSSQLDLEHAQQIVTKVVEYMTVCNKYKEFFGSFEDSICATIKETTRYTQQEEKLLMESIQKKIDKISRAIFFYLDSPNCTPDKDTYNVLFELIQHSLANHKKYFQGLDHYNTVLNAQIFQKTESMFFLMLRAVKLYMNTLDLPLDIDMNALIRDFSSLSLRPEHITCIREFVKNAQEKIDGEVSGKKVLFKLMIECLILLDMNISAKMLLDSYPYPNKENNLQYIYCDIMCGIDEFDDCCIAPNFCFFPIPQVSQSESRLTQIKSQIDRLLSKRSGLPVREQKELDHKLVLLSARELKLKALPTKEDVIKFCHDVSEKLHVDQLFPVDRYLFSKEVSCHTLKSICLNAVPVPDETIQNAIQKLDLLTDDISASHCWSFA
ncbi:MAG: hypothetical protein VX737_05075 [Pseudomonadota bacterium]|nr:hypothetical protein [Pseudomonadota bacterium]